MQTSILVISNCRNSSVSYMSSLRGYGFTIEDSRTFDTARILLRSGDSPDSIIIDVKFHADEISEFIHYVRTQINPSAHIILIGSEQDLLPVYGANLRLDRPVDFQQLVSVLEPVR